MSRDSTGSEDFRSADDANLKMPGLGGKGRVASHSISSLNMPFQPPLTIYMGIQRSEMKQHRPASDTRRTC